MKAEKERQWRAWNTRSVGRPHYQRNQEPVPDDKGAKNDFFATRFPSSMPNECLVVVADEPMNLHQLLPAAWIELFFEEEVSLASVCGWN